MTVGTLQYVDQPGLQFAIFASGNRVWNENGTWYADDISAVTNFIASYNPLAYVQRQALATVAETLASRLGAGFTYSGVLIDCGDQAQGRISRVAQMAADILDGKITKAWTSRTWPSMTPAATGLTLAGAQDMINMAGAVGSYVADNEFHAADLEAQILASTATAASIAALDLDNSKGTWPTS